MVPFWRLYLPEGVAARGQLDGVHLVEAGARELRERLLEARPRLRDAGRRIRGEGIDAARAEGDELVAAAAEVHGHDGS